MIANRTSANRKGEEMWNTDSADGTRLSSTVTQFDPNKYMTLTRF
jgi:hypothetical protein